MNLRTRVRALAAAPLLLLLASCTREAPPPPLRIAVNVWPGYDTLWLADQLGYTAAEGGTVRLATEGAIRALRDYGALSREIPATELLEPAVLRAALNPQ